MSNNPDIQENVAGLLCYIPGICVIASIVFLIIDKRKFVRFHAIQSLALCVVLFVVSMIISFILWFLSVFLSLAALALWIIMIIKAYRHEMYKLPVLGNLADQWSN